MMESSGNIMYSVFRHLILFCLFRYTLIFSSSYQTHVYKISINITFQALKTDIFLPTHSTATPKPQTPTY